MVAPWPLMEEHATTMTTTSLGVHQLPRADVAEAQFGVFQQLLLAVRSARAEYQVDPARKIGAVVRVKDEVLRGILEGEAAVSFTISQRINAYFADQPSDRLANRPTDRPTDRPTNQLIEY
jgi:valyl-tRNA synthetase